MCRLVLLQNVTVQYLNRLTHPRALHSVNAAGVGGKLCAVQRLLQRTRTTKTISVSVFTGKKQIEK